MAPGYAVAMLLLLLAGAALAAPADWSTAVSLATERTADGAIVTLSVADGFHVYGRRERWSVPLALTVDAPARKVRVPRGERRAHATGPAFVLSGDIPLEVRLRDAAPSCTGTLVYQVCTESECAPPAEVGWIAR